jgi:citrate synthase
MRYGSSMDFVAAAIQATYSQSHLVVALPESDPRHSEAVYALNEDGTRNTKWNCFSAQETLDAGKVVPGYGHAVLRITDPRFDAFHAFGARVCPDDPTYMTVARVFKIVPEVLKTIQKIKDPWPNVDAASGCLLYHFGMTEFSYYTVLFSVSRAMGMCSQLVVSRAWGEPIERPKSQPTKWIKNKVKSL